MPNVTIAVDIAKNVFEMIGLGFDVKLIPPPYVTAIPICARC